jgi:hypothetical protein
MQGDAEWCGVVRIAEWCGVMQIAAFRRICRAFAACDGVFKYAADSVRGVELESADC